MRLACWWFHAICSAAPLVIGAAAAAQEPAVVGTVTYRERIALPPGATVEVQLVDVSKMDVAAEVIAELTIHPEHQVPIPFRLPYQADRIDPRHSYAVQVRIEVEGRLWFVTSRSHPVLTRGHADEVEVLVQRVAKRSDAPDLAVMAARVERLREQLSGLDRIEGSYTAGDKAASWVAFVDGNQPLVVAEQWDLGDDGSGEAVFHFADGDLLRYRSRTRLLSAAGAPSDGWYERTITIYFENDRFAGGFGRIDRRSAEPDEHEVRGAYRQAQAVRERVASARATGASVVDPRRTRYACEDGAAFAVSFDRAGERAVVEFLGREPLYLRRAPVGSGFAYADHGHELRGKGEEAHWQVGDETPVRCIVAPSATNLRLAPGRYPVFDPTSGEHDWSRLLPESMPAIRACLSGSLGALPRVIVAWPMGQTRVGVRFSTADGSRQQCVAMADGRSVDSVRRLSQTVARLPGEGDQVFTPADGAYPEGPCFSHQRVMAGWSSLGWLSTRIC